MNTKTLCKVCFIIIIIIIKFNVSTIDPTNRQSLLVTKQILIFVLMLQFAFSYPYSRSFAWMQCLVTWLCSLHLATSCLLRSCSSLLQPSSLSCLSLTTAVLTAEATLTLHSASTSFSTTCHVKKIVDFAYFM